MREYERLRKRKLRQKKKLMRSSGPSVNPSRMHVASNDVAVTPTSTHQRSRPNPSPYKSVQALGKAVRRCKYLLPNTPRRRKRVVMELAVVENNSFETVVGPT